MKKTARVLSYFAIALAFVCVVGAILFFINISWNGQKFIPLDGERRVVKVLVSWLASFGPLTVLVSLAGLYLARISTRQTMKIRLWVGLLIGTFSALLGLVGGLWVL